MEEIYSRARQLGKGGEFKKYKRISSKVQGENECRSKEVKKARSSREKELQERGVAREIYSENIIQIE